MTTAFRKEDILDADIADAAELASDGSTSFLLDITVVSTTSSTKQIVLSGVYIINVPENRIEPGDSITLAGTSGGAADGTFTVASIVSDTILVVSEAIADSTGGTAAFTHKAGALRVGVDPTLLLLSSETTVQGVLEDLDASIVSGAITAAQHKALRQLIHFIGSNNPGDGFGDGPLYCETLPAGSPFPTSETWYETSGKLKKICSQEATYNSNKTFATETWTVYKSDGTNPAAIAIDTISYSGLFETTRSRAITVYS